ncbi:MAG: hypothetical protein P8Z39_05230, partial [Gammaproteobacteria bacterium]
SPIAYLVAAAFLLLSGLFFVVGAARWQDATLQPMFGSMSLVLIFLAPVLTMRLLSREQDQGTSELLLTAPGGEKVPLERGIITQDQADKLQQAEELRDKVIQVDAFKEIKPKSTPKPRKRTTKAKPNTPPAAP